MKGETVLKLLRDAALVEPDLLQRKLLRDSADAVQSAVQNLSVDATYENMQALNGAWVQADRRLKRHRDGAPPAGNGGSMRDPAMALAA